MHMRAARLLAATVRNEYLTAKYLHMDVTDQGGTSMTMDKVCDAGGESLAGGPEDMDCENEINYLTSCLTDAGSWTASEHTERGMSMIDIDRALMLPVPDAPTRQR